MGVGVWSCWWFRVGGLEAYPKHFCFLSIESFKSRLSSWILSFVLSLLVSFRSCSFLFGPESRFGFVVILFFR